MCRGHMGRDFGPIQSNVKAFQEPELLGNSVLKLLLRGLRDSSNHSSDPLDLKTPAFLCLLSDEVVFDSFVSMCGLGLDVESSLTLLLELSWT